MGNWSVQFWNTPDKWIQFKDRFTELGPGSILLPKALQSGMVVTHNSLR